MNGLLHLYNNRNGYENKCCNLFYDVLFIIKEKKFHHSQLTTLSKRVREA